MPSPSSCPMCDWEGGWALPPHLSFCGRRGLCGAGSPAQLFCQQIRFMLPCHPQQLFCACSQHPLLVLHQSSFLTWASSLFWSFIVSASPTHFAKSSSVSQLRLARWLSPGITWHRLARGIVSLCLVPAAFCFAALSLLAGISELSLGAATSPATGARCCLALIHHVSCCPGPAG